MLDGVRIREFPEASASLRKGMSLSAGFPGESMLCTCMSICTCLDLLEEQQGALQLGAIPRKAVIDTEYTLAEDPDVPSGHGLVSNPTSSTVISCGGC